MPTAGKYTRWTWAIEIESGTNDMIWLNLAGTGYAPVYVPAGTYYWRGDGTAADFCQAIKLALDSALGTFTVALSTVGVLTISEATSDFAINWGSSDLSSALLGFTGGVDSSSSHTLAGEFQVGHAWFPEQWSFRDSGDRPADSNVMTRTSSGRILVQQHGEETFHRDLGVDGLYARKIYQADEVRAQESFERWFSSSLALGEAFELTPDLASPGVYSQYQIRDAEWIRGLSSAVTEIRRASRRYLVAFPMQRVDP